MHTHRPGSLLTLWAAVAVAMAVAPGCGDDGTSPSTSGGGPDPGSDFFSRYAKALCDRTFACCDAAVRAAHDLDVSSADACASQLETILKGVSGGGGVQGTFVPEEGEACLAELDAAPCAEIQILGPLIGVNYELTPSCNEAWVGSVPEGGSCNTNWDCARDLCVGTVEEGQTTRACKARGALGEPCESTLECEDALRCDQPSPSSAGTCAPRVALGGSCAGSHDCAEELRCAEEGTCQPREQQGGPCMSDLDCAAGMTCDSSACAPLGAAGAPCSADSDCASFACVDATGTCADVCKGA